jgi:hypothetical protein
MLVPISIIRTRIDYRRESYVGLKPTFQSLTSDVWIPMERAALPSSFSATGLFLSFLLAIQGHHSGARE